MDEPDLRRHPNLNAKRLLLGMDFNAGSVVVLGAILFVVISAIGILSNHLIESLVSAFMVMGLCYLFARKFLNNRPTSYLSDWLESRRVPHYFPPKIKK